jgi:antitoxin VapB
VAFVDAAFILGTRPGRALGEIFQDGAAAYAQKGFPDEWQLHHQGGPAGYEPREYLGIPGATDIVSAGQAYAWNPSITGVKSEDTVLVGEAGFEVLTAIDGWPELSMVVNGQEFTRPAILEVW